MSRIIRMKTHDLIFQYFLHRHPADHAYRIGNHVLYYWVAPVAQRYLVTLWHVGTWVRSRKLKILAWKRVFPTTFRNSLSIGMAESFSRENLRHAPQKEGGWEILCDLPPVWPRRLVRPMNLMSRMNGKKTHTTHTRLRPDRLMWKKQFFFKPMSNPRPKVTNWAAIQAHRASRLCFFKEKSERTWTFWAIVWCSCMAINNVQYNGGFLPDIIRLTQCYYHRGTRLNAMKRFCLRSLWSHLNVLTFFPPDWGTLTRFRCVQIFL